MPDERLHDLDGPTLQLLVLEQELDDARSRNDVDELPASEQQFNLLEEQHPQIIQVLRNRLFRLGYLAEDNGEPKADGPLRDAVRTFQNEAAQVPGTAITVDGWVGEQTWQALQELFAFEPDTNLDRWLIDGQPSGVLCRAARLRLSVLGLEAVGPSTNEPIDGILAQWQHLLDELGIAVDTLAGDPTRALLEAMFDVGWLSSTLAEQWKSVLARFDKLQTKARRNAVDRFLNCLTQIELWLLDRPGVKPNGYARRIRVTRKHPNPPKYSPMYRSMRWAWKQVGMTTQHKSNDVILLLRTLRAVHTKAAVTMSGDGQIDESQEIIAAIEAQQEPIEKIWRNLGHRLWDGIKRVSRWIIGVFRRTAELVGDALRSLARAARYMASQAASLVRRGMRIFTDSVQILFRSEWPGSNQWIAMKHDGDMDFRVAVDRHASNDVLMAFFRNTRQLLASFDAATRVMRILLKLGLAVAKGFAGPWSWWSTIKILVGVYRALNEETEDRLRAPLPVLT